MGFDKLFAPLDGRPVVAHAIAAFEKTQSVSGIIIVGRAEGLSDFEALVAHEGFGKVSAIIPGGARRQDSVRCGLAQVKPEAEFVAVHDAARPLVSPELIEQIFALARRHGGAASAAPIADTLKRVDAERLVIGGVDRADLFAVQTPQIFGRDLLESGYRAVEDAAVEVTDEISAVELVHGKVALLPNDAPNFKITYPADLELAEFLLQRRAR